MTNCRSLHFRVGRCIAVIMMFLTHTSSIALSRVGTVGITDLNGIPCFSIPNNSETRNGLPLYGLFINELPSGEDHDSLPHSIWSFRATDYNALPKIFPKHCIPFGESPNGTTQRTLESLQLLKVYSVYLQAKREGSSRDGYSGEFCIKPAGSGKTFVQVIDVEYSLGDARFGDCKK